MVEHQQAVGLTVLHGPVGSDGSPGAAELLRRAWANVRSGRNPWEPGVLILDETLRLYHAGKASPRVQTGPPANGAPISFILAFISE